MVNQARCSCHGTPEKEKKPTAVRRANQTDQLVEQLLHRGKPRLSWCKKVSPRVTTCLQHPPFGQEQLFSNGGTMMGRPALAPRQPNFLWSAEQGLIAPWPFRLRWPLPQPSP